MSIIDSMPCSRSLQLVATKQPIADPIPDDLRDARLVLVAGKKVIHDLLDRADRQPPDRLQSLRAILGRTRSLRSVRRSRTRVGT
jgi:hypothetical protein